MYEVQSAKSGACGGNEERAEIVSAAYFFLHILNVFNVMYQYYCIILSQGNIVVLYLCVFDDYFSCFNKKHEKSRTTRSAKCNRRPFLPRRFLCGAAKAAPVIARIANGLGKERKGGRKVSPRLQV